MRGLPPLQRDPHRLDSWPPRIGLLRREMVDRPTAHRPGYTTTHGGLSYEFAYLLARRATAGDDGPAWVDPIAEWRADAICTSTAPPRATCNACPAKWKCLDWALRHEEPTGRWGGLSTMARQALIAAHHGDPVEALIAAWRSENAEPAPDVRPYVEKRSA